MRIEKEKDEAPIIYDAYNPVGFDTPWGIFYIVQRDYGFEIVKDAELVFTTKKGFIKYGEEIDRSK